MVEIDLTDSGQMMKVVRQNFCMHLERGEMPVTKAVKNWRLFQRVWRWERKRMIDEREEEVLVQQILAFLYTGFGRERRAVGEGRGRHPMDHRATHRCSTGSALAVPKPACLQ
jgi:hypothetical protein